MIQKFIIKEGHKRLLLFFAGWGMDEKPFAHYRPADRDFMVCYDYTDATFDQELISDYHAIDVVGWSFGVWMAAKTLTEVIALYYTTIAINGTIRPIDERRGIDPQIFKGTLDGLSEATLLKFRRRMCGGTEGYNEFMQHAPQRSIESLRTELKAIAKLYAAGGELEFLWSRAIVGESDAIFTTTNQLEAWSEARVLSILTDSPHYKEALFKHYLETIWTND